MDVAPRFFNGPAMSKSKHNKQRRSSKRVPFGIPRQSRKCSRREPKGEFFPHEDWYEPVAGEKDGYRIIEKDPGEALIHPVTPAEIAARLEQLPSWTLEDLDVVQLSRITKKKLRFPCYGLQWGTSLYLYPIHEDLTEEFSAPPSAKLSIETRMYGGRWISDESNKIWILEWNEKTIRDYYLNNVLIHELGHLVDDRNRSYQDREKYADWFAIEYGYRQSRANSNSKRRTRVKKRHHQR